MKNMSLTHAGWVAENYHTGDKSPRFNSYLVALWWAIINGPEYTVREIKEPSALSS